MSYQIALSALQAINSQLDTISQNIANTGTTGYNDFVADIKCFNLYSTCAPIFKQLLGCFWLHRHQ